MFGERWLLLTGKERDLIDNLYESCTRLGDPVNSENIFVGIQTSADAIYHLRKLGVGRYLCSPKGDSAPPAYEVEIEDTVMKPLISGDDAKRYIEPNPKNYLLFPYEQTSDGVKLIPSSRFEKSFPKAWKYLQSYEQQLRARESGKMDDDGSWWAYNYPKNLDKQEIQKLVVPRIVSNVFCSVDERGANYLDNVDVGGISPSTDVDPFFLAGVINGPVARYVFRRISKPFRGDYRSANKQFIAPLPIPFSDAQSRSEVSGIARDLQSDHTRRRDVLVAIAHRIGAVQTKKRAEDFLFPDLISAKARVEIAPKNLEQQERQSWAKARFKEDLDARHMAIGARLRPGVDLEPNFQKGELSLAIDGVTVLDRIFLSDSEGAFVAAQWKVIASTFVVTERTDGEALCNALRKLIVTDNAALQDQIVALEKQLSEIEKQIAEKEQAINTLLYRLYDLSEAEIVLIEAG